MVRYVLLGSNDLERSKTFYDAVLAESGAGRGFATDRMQAYSKKGSPVLLGVCTAL